MSLVRRVAVVLFYLLIAMLALDALIANFSTTVPGIVQLQASNEIQPSEFDIFFWNLWWVRHAISLGDKPTVIRAFVERAGLSRALSPEERALLQKNRITKKDGIKYSWRTEAMVALLWALRRLPALDQTAKQADLDTVFEAVPTIDDDPKVFVREAELRPKSELLDMADWVYRAHWAVRHASLNGVPASGPLDGGVVMEWHQALNWLIRHDDEDNCDFVATDTMSKPRPGSLR